MDSISKRGKTSKIVSLILALTLVVCLLFSVSVQVSAETTSASDEVKAVSNSLMQVRMVYDAGDTRDHYSLGSGFLINSNTLLTCNHVISLTHKDDAGKTTADYLKEAYGSNYNKDKVSYEVVVSNDVTIPVTVKKTSEDLDFAILNLTEAIYNRTFAPLGDSDDLVQTQTVYSFGFPQGITEINDSNVYTSNDVTITDGRISKLTTVNNIDYIQNSSVLHYGNSGGPLVNEEGNVVGINQLSVLNDKYYYAISINQIKTILSDLGIEYTEGSATVAPTEDAPYTQPQQEITDAPEIKVPVTVTPSVDKTDTGIDATKLIIIAAIAVLVIALIVVVILIVLNSGKKAKAQIPAQPQRPSMPAAPQPPVNRQANVPNFNAQPQSYNSPNAGYFGSNPTAVSNEGAGETSVLNEGAGETTVLGYQPAGATLLRKSTGEKINIDRPEFTIGKEKRRVDFCIANNNSVSRTHAKIRVRAGKCYIADLGSTNFTYVNGTKLSPNQEVALSKGDKIKISDEEFEFLG